MKKIILTLLTFILLVSCNHTEKKKFVPNPKYDVGELIYLKPDSTQAYVKFYSVLVDNKEIKPPTYFYGIEYKDNVGKFHRRIIGDKEIFGSQTKKEDL